MTMRTGDRIKFLRGHLTQDEFAKTLGTVRNSIQVWETDKGSPACKHYLRFYKTLGVNINWLLSGEGKAYVNNPGNRGLLEYKLTTLESKIKALEIKIANMAGGKI